MSRRKVYIVESGAINKATNTFWLTPTYFSSKKVAMAEAEQILEINRAKDIVEHDRWVEVDPNILRMTDYIGEEGKYKARVQVKWAWLNHY